MKSAGKARSNGLYRHIRTSKEIIRNLLNDLSNYTKLILCSHKMHKRGEPCGSAPRVSVGRYRNRISTSS